MLRAVIIKRHTTTHIRSVGPCCDVLVKLAHLICLLQATKCIRRLFGPSLLGFTTQGVVSFFWSLILIQ